MNPSMLNSVSGYSAFILFAASSLQQVGLQYTPAGKAGFLTALYMVLVPIAQIFMRKYAEIFDKNALTNRGNSGIL